MSGPSPEALLAAPAGRAVLAELIGIDPLDLLAELGEPTPAGTARLTSGTTRADRRPSQAAPAGHRREAADAVTAAVADVDLSQLADCRDRLLLLSMVAAVIEGQQAAAGAALAAAGNALLPVAEALAAAPAARWWWQPVDRNAQRWVGADGAVPPRGTGVTEAARRIVAEEEQDEDQENFRPASRFWPSKRDVEHSGSWWSAPLGGTVFTTTGPIDLLPAVELGCVADSAGEEQVQVWAVDIDAAARVREIGGPADWTRLTSEFPRDVTGSRGYDWGRRTGQTGPWVLPDWSALAREWDGIHLSVGGWLTAGGLPLPAGNATTLLLGWDPDRTLWLNDVFAKVEYIRPWRGSPGSEAMPDVIRPWLKHH